MNTVELHHIVHSRLHPLFNTPYKSRIHLPDLPLDANIMDVDADTFTELPILLLSQALDPDTRPRFLADLRSALLNVGFLYLSETGLPEQLVADVIDECKGFFENLPQEEKERIEMKNEKSFLGWSRVSL